MMLFVDGLNKGWKEGKTSEWEKSNNEFNKKFKGRFAINRLHRSHDESDKDTANVRGRSISTEDFRKYVVDGKRVVKLMPLEIFQERLVEHFDIRYKQKSIVWPARLSKPTTFV